LKCPRLVQFELPAEANKAYGELGGHVASYASAAEIFEIGFNHFFRGGAETSASDLVFFQPVPYAQGYAELNYTIHKLKIAAGLTYFGNNNTYNEPAFGVLQANIRYDLSKRAYLLVSGNNLTNAYGSAFFTESSGTPVPLVNGQFGATAGGTIGPAYFRLNLHVQTGS
jgi:hypothetical protein